MFSGKSTIGATLLICAAMMIILERIISMSAFSSV